MIKILIAFTISSCINSEAIFVKREEEKIEIISLTKEKALTKEEVKSLLEGNISDIKKIFNSSNVNERIFIYYLDDNITKSVNDFPIYIAIRKMYVEVIKYFLSIGAKVNIYNSHSLLKTPLALAIRCLIGQEEGKKKNKDQKKEIENNENIEKMREIIKLLLDEGAHIYNDKLLLSKTPLYIAFDNFYTREIKDTQYEALKLLLEKKFFIEIGNNDKDDKNIEVLKYIFNTLIANSYENETKNENKIELNNIVKNFLDKIISKNKKNSDAKKNELKDYLDTNNINIEEFKEKANLFLDELLINCK